MEIRITRTTEYVIDIDDDDTEVLEQLDRYLSAPNGTAGDYLVERVDDLHCTDPQDLLKILCESPLVDVASDSYCSDSYDVDGLTGPWAPSDDDDEEASEPVDVAGAWR